MMHKLIMAEEHLKALTDYLGYLGTVNRYVNSRHVYFRNY